MIRFQYPGPAPDLVRRKLLLLPVGEFHARALGKMENLPAGGDSWTIELSENLFFDESGLQLLAQAVRDYSGKASVLNFRLKLSDAAYRPYYSLGEDRGPDSAIALPVMARRERGGEGEETLTLAFPNPLTEYLRFPDSLAPSEALETPLQLLLPRHCEHDLLFANQILVLANLARRAKASPRAWLGLVTQRHLKSPAKRVAMAYRQIHPSTQVHPTAVIEGSVIGAGSVVGAHCVVRCSVVGENVTLRDGAKVEFSVVGDGSHLMHDLVLVRSHVEDEVFLIHGPYQFSLFQSHSSAFATIMMDYRADSKPIKVATPTGVREYQGRFLGAVLKEYAKSLGGSLLAPGIVVPEKAWLAAELSQVHKTLAGPVENFKALSPSALAGRDKEKA